MNAVVGELRGADLVKNPELTVFVRRYATATFVSIHSQIQKWGAFFGAWIVGAAWFGFSGTATIDIAIAICAVTLVMYLGVPIVLARTGGYAAPKASFRDYLAGELETYGGVITGWDAMIQILTVPACLALGITFMAGLFLWIS
jgi:hypothetical protein